MDCVERCSAPYFRKGKQLDDPLCKEKDVDDDKCCAIMVCAADTGKFILTFKKKEKKETVAKYLTLSYRNRTVGIMHL